jgi:hypothetical protein
MPDRARNQRTISIRAGPTTSQARRSGLAEWWKSVKSDSQFTPNDRTRPRPGSQFWAYRPKRVDGIVI